MVPFMTCVFLIGSGLWLGARCPSQRLPNAREHDQIVAPSSKRHLDAVLLEVEWRGNSVR
jgi:hypothetical protein